MSLTMEQIPAAARSYELVLEPGRTEKNYWRDLWVYRELFYFLAWRDIVVRYKQTAIGLAWALLEPLAHVLIGVVIFGNLANLPDNGIPYPALVAIGVAAWQLFDKAFTGCSESLVKNANLLSKIYFPRMIVPASAVIVSVVNFLISLAIIIALLAWYHIIPSWRVIFLPFFILLTFAVAMGAGLWFATLNVEYRDVRIITPFISRFGVLLSPVYYLSSAFSERLGPIYYLNPLAGIIDGFRWCMIEEGTALFLPGVVVSIAFSFVLLQSGIMYFRRMEKRFADVI